MYNFTTEQIPNQAGKKILITGGNTGLGFEAAKVLARAGATVHIACRNPLKGEEALKNLRPHGEVHLEILDLSNLGEVKAFAKVFGQTPLDVLINNAGVMGLLERTLTINGLETQMGVNHFGHFALTNGLLKALEKSPAPRVVTVSSMAAHRTKLKLDNLNSEKSYNPYWTYCRSKLANILFANELALLNKWLISLAVHPGVTPTDIKRNLVKSDLSLITATWNVIGHPVEAAVLPILYAATMDVKSGMYIGPKYKIKGPVAHLRQPAGARSKTLGSSLWEISKGIVDKI